MPPKLTGGDRISVAFLVGLGRDWIRAARKREGTRRENWEEDRRLGTAGERRPICYTLPHTLIVLHLFP